MKKILLFGGTGGIGTKICEILGKKYQFVSIGSKICDVTHEESVKQYFDENVFELSFTTDQPPFSPGRLTK
jgi:dTDP-4-dehydrorhamnose reductase